MLGFLSFSYWFSLFPPALLLTAQIAFGALFLVLVAAGLVTLYVFRRNAESKLRKRALGTIGQSLLWAGICGLAWLFMTVFGVPLLGMRFWLVVGFLFFTWLLVAPVRALRSSIPEQERLASSKASYEKWLPKPKK
jgi:hypothetical protein